MSEKKNSKYPKTVNLTVTFWTNDLGELTAPAVCWDGGVVSVNTNPRHGIKATGSPIPFVGLLALPHAIGKALGHAGVRIVTGGGGSGNPVKRHPGAPTKRGATPGRRTSPLAWEESQKG